MRHTHVLCITGPLGAGKTTTLFRLRPPKGTQLVVNEIGELKIDVERLIEQFGSDIDVASLVAGCLGCDNAAGFDAIVASTVDKERELLIVEPTGVADAREIKAITDRHNLSWTCLTLVNPVTFRRNKVEGILATQLAVATAVVITRSNQLDDEREAEILAYIAHHAPAGIPIHKATSKGALSFSLTDLLALAPNMGKEHHGVHVHDEHCDHMHGSHGHVSVALSLRQNVSLDDLLAAMTPVRNQIARAKGIVAGHWFDVVGPEATIGEPTNGEPHVVLIAGEPINTWLFASLQAERPSLPSKKLLMTSGDHEVADVIAAIVHHADSYPDPCGADGLPILGPDNDIAVYLSRTPGVPVAYQEQALRARMRFLLRANKVLASAEARGLYDPSPERLANDLLEAGAALAWNAQNKPGLVGDVLVAEIAAQRPAHQAMRGLSLLTTLNLHLLPEDSQGPTTPHAIASIAQFGLSHEGMNENLPRTAMRHALALASGHPVWEDRWAAAIAKLG